MGRGNRVEDRYVLPFIQLKATNLCNSSLLSMSDTTLI